MGHYELCCCGEECGEGADFFDVQSENDFDQNGWWTIWQEVFFDDDRTACGKVVKFYVYEAGQ